MLGKIVSLLEKLAFFSLLFCFQFPFQFSPVDFVSFSVARGVSLRTTENMVSPNRYVSTFTFMIQMQLWCALIWRKNDWTFEKRWRCILLEIPELWHLCVWSSQEVRTEYTTLLCWWRKLLSPPNIRFSSNHSFKQFLFIMLYNILEMHKYSLKVSRIH